MYDADPRLVADAVKFDTISYDEVLRRGLQVADATAFSLCRDNGMPIVVFQLTDGNIARVVRGEKIGTLVSAAGLSQARQLEKGSTVIDETLFEAEEKMEKAVHVARDELGGLRTGRANASAFARLVVDYYGAPTPIPQMATVNIPEARMAVIKPYDAGAARRDREGDPRQRPGRESRPTTARSSASCSRS